MTTTSLPQATAGERAAYRAGWRASSSPTGPADMEEAVNIYLDRTTRTDDREVLYDAFVSGWLDVAVGRNHDPERGNRAVAAAMLADEERTNRYTTS